MGGIAIEKLIDNKRRDQRIAEIEDQLQIEERLIYAKRTTRVTKGGKRLTSFTITLFSSLSTLITSPVFPFSLPLITTTVSPSFTSCPTQLSTSFLRALGLGLKAFGPLHKGLIVI